MHSGESREAQAELERKREASPTPFRLWFMGAHDTLLQPRDFPHTRTPRHLRAGSALAWETICLAMFFKILKPVFLIFNYRRVCRDPNKYAGLPQIRASEERPWRPHLAARLVNYCSLYTGRVCSLILYGILGSSERGEAHPARVRFFSLKRVTKLQTSLGAGSEFAMVRLQPAPLPRQSVYPHYL